MEAVRTPECGHAVGDARAPEPSAWTIITWSLPSSATTGSANDAPSGDQSRWLRAYWSKKGRTWSTKTSETGERPVRADRARLGVDEREPELHGRLGGGRRGAASRRAPPDPRLATLSSPGAGTPSAAIVLPSGAQKKATTVPSSRVRTSARRAVHQAERSDRQRERRGRVRPVRRTRGRSSPHRIRRRPCRTRRPRASRSRRASRARSVAVSRRRPSAKARKPSVARDGRRAEGAREDGGRFGRDPVGSDLAEEAGDALAAAVDEQPGRVRPRPVHRRAFADDRRRARSRRPGRGAARGRPGSVVRNVSACPSGDQ